MVEQGTHKPLDVSSNLTLATRRPITWVFLFFGAGISYDGHAAATTYDT